MPFISNLKSLFNPGIDLIYNTIQDIWIHYEPKSWTIRYSWLNVIEFMETVRRRIPHLLAINIHHYLLYIFKKKICLRAIIYSKCIKTVEKVCVCVYAVCSHVCMSISVCAGKGVYLSVCVCLREKVMQFVYVCNAYVCECVWVVCLCVCVFAGNSLISG